MRAVLLILAGLLTAGSGHATESALITEAGWIKAAPPVAPVRAGYLRLRNPGDGAVTISRVRSEAFGAIEIHEMQANDEGMMRMRRVPALTVAAGERLELKPGGLHLMMFRPQRPLATGDEIDVVLVLDDGREVGARLVQR